MLSIYKKTIIILICFGMFACDSRNDTQANRIDAEIQTFSEFNVQNTEHYQREYYENSNLKVEGMMLNGKKNGHWKFYYPNGDWKSGGHYLNDKKEGWWEEFAAGKIKIEEGNFKLGKREGTFVKYHPNAKVYLSGTYSNDEKSGWWEEFDSLGNKVYEGYFSKGKRNGYARFYLDKNTTSDGNFENNAKIGEWKTYKNGKVIAIEFYD